MTERETELKAIIDDIEPPYNIIVEKQIEELLYIECRLAALKGRKFVLKNGKGESRITAAGKQYKEFSQIRDGIIRNLVKVIEKHTKKKQNEFTQWLAKQNF